ncbi:MAG: hypothetical protein QOJ92_476 [Frankiales bacterium]|nr:hypothetical protein [Frankiales bacterium]
MSQSIEGYVADHGSDLIRFCTALAGVAGSSLAVEGVVALRERAVRRGEQVAHRAVLRRAVRTYLKGRYPAPEGVTPQSWAAAALTSLENVPPHELHWFLGSEVQVPDVEVPSPALGPAPEDLARRGHAALTIHRRARRGRYALVATAVALISLLTVGAYSVLTHVSRPDIARGDGLIKWEPRGDLLLDEKLRHDAERVWRQGVSNKLDQVQTLWAGHVGHGRLVVLQGYDQDEAPQVAAIGEEKSGLVLLRSDPMSIAPDVLIIPYSGLPDLALTSYSHGARLVRALVDPAAEMERRSLTVRALADEDKLGPWEPLVTHAGLSAPWLDLSADFAVTALRDRGTTYLVTDTESLLTQQPVLSPSPAKLRAESQDPPSDAQLADDVLAIEQYAFVPEVDVSLLWVGFGTSDSTSIRLYNLVPRPGCSDECERGLWAVAGTDGVANPVDGSIVDGSLVIHLDEYVVLIGAPGSATCQLSGDDVDRLGPAHLQAATGVSRTFVCKDARGHVVSHGPVTKA